MSPGTPVGCGRQEGTGISYKIVHALKHLGNLFDSLDKHIPQLDPILTIRRPFAEFVRLELVTKQPRRRALVRLIGVKGDLQHVSEVAYELSSGTYPDGLDCELVRGGRDGRQHGGPHVVDREGHLPRIHVFSLDQTWCQNSKAQSAFTWIDVKVSVLWIPLVHFLRSGRLLVATNRVHRVKHRAVPERLVQKEHKLAPRFRRLLEAQIIEIKVVRVAGVADCHYRGAIVECTTVRQFVCDNKAR